MVDNIDVLRDRHGLWTVLLNGQTYYSAVGAEWSRCVDEMQYAACLGVSPSVELIYVDLMTHEVVRAR